MADTDSEHLEVDLESFTVEELLERLDISEEELEGIVGVMHADTVTALAQTAGDVDDSELPTDPIELGMELESKFKIRDHIVMLSNAIVDGLNRVERGEDVRMIVEMPPRSGKTFTGTMLAAAWILAHHPDWPIVLISHASDLAVKWGRDIRRWADQGLLPNVRITKDSKAASEWETERGGSVLSRSVRESLTGRGAKVMIVDDPTKDFVEAHSETVRNSVWNWWLSVAQTRLEPPSMVIVTATRWHEDDLIGRLKSTEYPGNPDDWEVISLPAIAEKADAIGRAEGEPLLSPLIEETPEQAKKRLAQIEEDVGPYTWASLYQQRPAPEQGAIFNNAWWKYWTTNPDLVTEDGRVVLLPELTLRRALFVDSWDTSFKGSETSDWVVGQRWARLGPNRFLLAQQRGRWSFTEAIEAMMLWANTDPAINPWGDLVHIRLVEDSANGPAIIDRLKREISGMEAVKARDSKEARARAVTPEIASGHVYLPHPRERGFEWVKELISELRGFPRAAHDDQVDALTQALQKLRSAESGGISVPQGDITIRTNKQTRLNRSLK